MYYGALAIAAAYELTAIVHLGFFTYLHGVSLFQLTLALSAAAVGNNKEALIYTALAVLCLSGAMNELGLSGIIYVQGPKGTVGIAEKANKSGKETELFLPDEYYSNLNKNIEKGYQNPNTKQTYTRLGNTSHEVETSVVISDEYGRIQYRIDYSTHGNDLAHTNPHIHEFVGNTTKGVHQIQEFRYFIDESTGKMRLGKADNNGTYNWLD